MKYIHITIAMAATMLPSWTVAESVAQEEKPKTQLTWKDLGFNGFPEGLSTDEIALIESLNRGRGDWAFKGSASRSDGTTPIQGKLEVTGSAMSGMIPMWGMVLRWPLEDPKQLADRCERLGWIPLKKAIRYDSPPKPNGAMTTYFYDREAGASYHERGYW